MSDWTSQRLGEHHDLAQLDCGRDELDQWLLNEALRDDAAHRFYLHHDFQPIQGSRRLVMKIATARAALDR